MSICLFLFLHFLRIKRVHFLSRRESQYFGHWPYFMAYCFVTEECVNNSTCPEWNWQESVASTVTSFITTHNTTRRRMQQSDVFAQNECCGISNYTDWHQNEQYNRTNSVPESCCKNEEEGCGNNGLIDPSKIHQKVRHGCSHESGCRSTKKI